MLPLVARTGWFRRVNPRRATIVAGVILGLTYAMVYVSLTWIGEYSSMPVISGKFRYSDGMGIPDVWVWNPVGVRCYPFEKNWLGLVYYPLVRLDRGFIHRDRSVLDVGRQDSRSEHRRGQ